jgi:hypothetical protein
VEFFHPDNFGGLLLTITPKPGLLPAGLARTKSGLAILAGPTPFTGRWPVGGWLEMAIGDGRELPVRGWLHLKKPISLRFGYIVYAEKQAKTSNQRGE